MAIPASGLIIEWGGDRLFWVRDIDVDLVIDEETAIIPRSGFITTTPATGTVGRVLLTGFSETNLGPSELGEVKLMEIKKRFRAFNSSTYYDRILWKGFCRYDRRRFQAVVNEAILFAFEFRFMTQPDSVTGTDTAPASDP